MTRLQDTHRLANAFKRMDKLQAELSEAKIEFDAAYQQWVRPLKASTTREKVRFMLVSTGMLEPGKVDHHDDTDEDSGATDTPGAGSDPRPEVCCRHTLPGRPGDRARKNEDPPARFQGSVAGSSSANQPLGGRNELSAG